MFATFFSADLPASHVREQMFIAGLKKFAAKDAKRDGKENQREISPAEDAEDAENIPLMNGSEKNALRAYPGPLTRTPEKKSGVLARDDTYVLAMVLQRFRS